ncbi:MAG: tRNA (cytidine(34)-2'-O)-methyltransferase [Leptospiraceae bacterium]|nr:tRNA (cytidine(34)-2'-O)-methyltransferase [Leptospiraceae bacterium]
MKLHIALYRPEIPPNTGNIARLCVGANLPLHIVGKPAFDLSEKAVRRAGLDYWKHLKLFTHESFEEFRNSLPKASVLYLVSKFGKTLYTKPEYKEGDILFFGNETSGVPKEIHEAIDETNKIYLPMPGEVRSLNLSNAVAIVAFEALRQIEYW